MNIVILLGSRNPKGQTARAAAAMAQGAQSAGARTETFYLPLLKIERCRQCDDSGWGLCRREGKCVIQDEFAGLVDKLKAADAAVFATPVYFGDLAESMKAFTDRLRRTCMHESGKSGIGGKPAVGICVAGGGGGGAQGCTESLERVLRVCGCDLVDFVPVRRQNLQMKLEVLGITGKWLASVKAGQS